METNTVAQDFPVVCVGGSAGGLDAYMPESAIASGCIDFILSPEDIAKEIIRIANAVHSQHPTHLIKENSHD